MDLERRGFRATRANGHFMLVAIVKAFFCAFRFREKKITMYLLVVLLGIKTGAL